MSARCDNVSVKVAIADYVEVIWSWWQERHRQYVRNTVQVPAEPSGMPVERHVRHGIPYIWWMANWWLEISVCVLISIYSSGLTINPVSATKLPCEQTIPWRWVLCNVAEQTRTFTKVVGEMLAPSRVVSHFSSSAEFLAAATSCHRLYWVTW